MPRAHHLHPAWPGRPDPGPGPRPSPRSRRGGVRLRALLAVVLVAAAGFLARPLLRSAPEERPAEATPAGGSGAGAREPLATEATDPRTLPAPHARPRLSLDGVPLEWIERNNAATALLAEEEYERAIEGFEACHLANPDHAVFRLNLVEALVRHARRLHDLGELAPAVRDLGRAVELGVEREDRDVLREVLARWEKELELERGHEERGSDLFELSYDTSRTDLLHHSQEVLDHLERVYEDLREWFVADPVREGGRAPIRVVLYTREEFDRLTGLGDWAGGVFDGVVRVPVEDLLSERTSWEEVLRHELVHAFLHAIGGRTVPGWLNEGLAQYLERRPHVDAARRRLAEALAAGHELYPLEDLEGSLASWSDAGAISLAYAQSLVLVDHVARHYGTEVLRAMVRAHGTGEGAAAAFEERTAVPLSFVLEDLRRYL